ncbi:HD domain-containing protein [Gracilibacillus alcaliphilus]|uniref:HD domain-containing protein n=1 Tax=Gracilibacillus alcaliphilus TaxID=1401441 RepID=UPI001EF81F21|nr:HD domain-containing protein [Gracilibacillus alcaliphilus]MBM7675738.1 HD superfamily phosphodiesterase [Gracilibacillus alcaliphilus]
MDVVVATRKFVKQKLSGEATGHDWWHIERVYSNSLQIMEETNKQVDKEVVELAALLHDIADWKFHHGDEQAGPRVAREWLESQHVEQDMINHVCQIIQDLSFKGAGVTSSMESLEGQIVQDADRLDAMGAIGIARAFAYGGIRGRSYLIY